MHSIIATVGIPGRPSFRWQRIPLTRETSAEQAAAQWRQSVLPEVGSQAVSDGVVLSEHDARCLKFPSSPNNHSGKHVFLRQAKNGIKYVPDQGP